MTPEQRQKAIFTLNELPIIIDPLTAHQAWLETLDLADRYGLTLYGAAYLELALRRVLSLATYDKALREAAKHVGVQALFTT